MKKKKKEVVDVGKVVKGEIYIKKLEKEKEKKNDEDEKN